MQAFNLFAYCSNNPVMNIDPFGTFNFGMFIATAVLVVAVAAACAVTAGCAAVAVAAVTSVAVNTTVVMTATAVAGVVAGSVAMADQIIENGDVVDPISVLSDTYTTATSIALETITGGQSKLIKAGAFAVEGLITIGTDSIVKAIQGDNFGQAVDDNSKEFLVNKFVSSTLDPVFFPHATDVLVNIAALAFPTKE